MNDQDPTDVPTADPRPAKLTRATSLVLVNTGPGKGKTSAAIGVVIRGVARG
nr:cob(I)yrinic acid a,c-diamide adenosyltransferase [Candidatus Microthrix sp.]